MKLTRPLVCLDLETTSPKPDDARIVQIAFVVRKPDGSELRYSTLINPCLPIPKGATEIHGITDAMVNGCKTCGHPKESHVGPPADGVCHGDFRPWPRFVDIAPNLQHGFNNVDFAGYNLKSFDLPCLAAEFARNRWEWSYRSARVLDAYRLWQIVDPRTLTGAVKKYAGREMENAHEAMADVEATFDVLDAMLAQHTELPADLDALHELQWPDDKNLVDASGKFIWKDGEVIINFSKHKGTPLRLIDAGFLAWMLKGEFSAEVKDIVRNAKKGVYPTRNLPTSA